MSTSQNKELNLFPIDYPFETLVDRVNKSKLILTPDFQRKYKWDRDGNERCSKFIESCLMRIPLPACYFAENADGNHLVIDGVQRITTIKRFFNDEFALEGLNIFSELNGKKFSDLGEYKNELETTTMRCIILRKDNPQGIVQEIFARLNQGSVILSAQEIRHAIYPGKFDDLLRKLSEIEEVKNFKESKSSSKEHNVSLESEELVLRFFALNSDLAGYQENLSKYLDQYMQKAMSFGDDEIEQMQTMFLENIKKCTEIFGDMAFVNLAKKRNRQSAALWDLQMICFVPYSLEQLLGKKNEIVDGFAEICNNPDFIKSISGRTQYKSNILRRKNLWENKLAEILK